ncbi:MAG TPA: alpha/beta fold hydrolase [Anaerolineaceae bacterium]|nr:alpha/beta fold hydrolase [Anaerolineaceae bacterium]
MTTKNQPTSSAKDMQSAKLRGLPFKNNQMNFFFLSASGADVYGGATLGESYYAAGQIKDGDIQSWIQAFGEVAGQAERQAQDFLAHGCRESARQAFLRAANYYYAADHYTDNRHPKYIEFWQHSVNCFHQAAGLFTPPIEPLSYELEGHSLCAYFIPAQVVQGKARGTILAMSGFDGTPEHLYFSCGAGLSQRGYNVLIFEGPGQRGMSHHIQDLPFRANYETAVKQVVDLALSHPGVEPERIGLLGYSFGGHLVLRAAACEPRIKALIADSPVMDFGKQMLDGFPAFATRTSDRMVNWLMSSSIGFMSGPLQASLKRLYESMGVSQFSDFRRKMAGFRFEEIERIACPTLCLISEGEGASAVAEGRQVFERLPHPQKKLVIFSAAQGADIHCQLNNLVLSVSHIVDWLDEIWQ